ncbi:MAG: aspartyl protease family protein [Candidatus Krumholzibacteria bacterium]|nr:aspartyl protease family protein [Candidatus Krumholzibacteria bacterium]
MRDSMKFCLPAFPILCFLGCLAAAPAAAQPALPGPPVPIFTKGDSVEVAGVEFFDRIIYLPVSINGLEPFPFVLDTGDGQLTAIDAGLAAKIGLKSTIIGEGGGAGEETVSFGLTDSTTVSFPGLVFRDRPLLTIPLLRMAPHWGKTKEGLIGGDILSTLVTRIDYGKGRLYFHDAASYVYRGPGERIPVTIENNFIFVQAGVLLYGNDEPIPANFLLDTGVRISLFNTPFAKQHDLAGQSPLTTSGITGYGLSGVSRGTAGRVRGVEIGSIRFDAPVMTFSADTAGALAAEDFSGIIGADFLSRFTVVIDYGRSVIYLEKNSSFGEPFEFDMSGIRFTFEGEKFDLFRVFSVFENSPAELAGIEEGDVVKAIDGRPASEFTKDSLRKHLERDGALVVFTIERGGAIRDVGVRLKRMV